MATKNVTMDDETRSHITTTLAEISRLMKGEIYEIDGTPKGLVKLPNGDYRNRPFNPNQEFEFRHFYLSKTGKPIAIFAPVDDQEWEHAEFGLKELDEAFPLFGSQLGARGKQSTDYEDMQSIYRAMLKMSEDAWKAEREKKRLAEEAEQQKIKEANPLWGRF